MRPCLLIGFFFISQFLQGQGPVARWPFDNHAKDESGNRNDGIIHGNVTSTTDRYGNPCGAYHFDGVNSYIEVPSSPSLESPVYAFTVAVWYRFDAAKDYNWLTILCKGSMQDELPGNPQYRLQVQQNGANVVNACSPYVPSGSSTISINTEFTECDASYFDHLFEINKWNFYAIVYDGQKVTAYMNNSKVFEFFYSGIFSVNQSPLYIGLDEPGSREYFQGSMDDLVVYNRALSQTEIQNIFSNSNRRSAPAKEEFRISQPPGKTADLPNNACEVVVDFDPPYVMESGCGNVTVRQVAGLLPGSKFPAGRHLISYEALSTTGYVQYYSFYVIVRDRSAPRLTMPPDTIIYAAAGLKEVAYDYGKIYASDNCGNPSVNRLSGKSAGDLFEIGKHVIEYKATDVSNNYTVKRFTVEVRERPVVPPGKPGLPERDSVKKPEPTVPEAKITDTLITPPPKEYKPEDLDRREKKEKLLLEVDSSYLRIMVYDNGVYDGDTISLFLNQKVFCLKEEVTEKGKEFRIRIDTTIDNELVMYAENLGTISPNTALLVLYDGDKRHEINLLSTMDTNGTIRIRKRK